MKLSREHEGEREAGSEFGREIVESEWSLVRSRRWKASRPVTNMIEYEQHNGKLVF